MPELWILLALAAGTFQTVRNALSNSLAGAISPALNSWSRFAFNLPFSVALVGAVVAIAGLPRASPTSSSTAWAPASPSSSATSL